MCPRCRRRSMGPMQTAVVPNNRPPSTLRTVLGEAVLLLLALSTMLAGVIVFIKNDAPLKTVAAPNSPRSSDVVGVPDPARTATGRIEVILFVDEDEEASKRTVSAILGARGAFKVSFVVAASPWTEQVVRQMVLGNEAMCPAGSCGRVVLIDLRKGS